MVTSRSGQSGEPSCFRGSVRSRTERLTRQKEAELQRHLVERQQDISHMQDVLETKVQLLREVQTPRHHPPLDVDRCDL